MAKLDPKVLAHLEWIGFVRPTGLVVSAPALVRAGAILDRRDAEGQRLLRACTEEREFNTKEGPVPSVTDFEAFAASVLGWNFSPKGYAGTKDCEIPDELKVTLPDFDVTLSPDYAVRELEPNGNGSAWQLLVKVLEPGADFDQVARGSGQLEASPHGRMERLLRRTGVPAGLLFNSRTLRLVSAPRGESSGWLDFQISDMVQTAGRPISTALRLLLSQQRLLALPRAERLAALLEDSRKFQNEVSERLAEQVLHALYELLRGFQAAHDGSKGELLRGPLAEHPDEVYRALLVVILRLVFLLYAEERDMLSEDETFVQHYSLAGLYERLREDAALFPDTMDQRFGAWAQLLVLFRLVHDGVDSGAMHLPQRHGVLFDPDRFPFLEGRGSGGSRQIHERIEPPLVPDGTISRALDKLLVLDGERISYRALDVEQIGSVYETMMGFRLETATGTSAAVKAAKKHGAPATIDFEALLGTETGKRRKWIQDRADRKLTDKVHKAVKAATTLEDLHAALNPVLDQDATPDLVPAGAMILQPSEERRRSGSHYTPRNLTEPIVRNTIEPILDRLREDAGGPIRPDQILELKVCDPAMGSGAFLVEACRQLGDALVEAWRTHDELPEIPPDEDEVLYARRLVAQRCLYGVDKNPVAVDLSKVSLWLVTLAKEHPFTFVDHALRHGDSLVGLSRRQIEAFHWDGDAPVFQAGLETMQVREHVASALELRQQIREAGDHVTDRELRVLWGEAEHDLGKVRFFGDLVVAVFFSESKAKAREARRASVAAKVLRGEESDYRGWLEELREVEPPLVPFHWEVEFPEVFEREKGGFDGIVGNPPFLGGSKISTTFGMAYFSYLRVSFAPAGHQCDLVGYFFRRAFSLLRSPGTAGLIATKTIAQGDTRNGSLVPILNAGGQIYSVKTRFKWPGQAVVLVTPVHFGKGTTIRSELDGRSVERISAYLVAGDVDAAPAKLASNPYFSKGSQIYGQGFTFDDSDAKANSTAEMHRLIDAEPQSADRIFPFVGGVELNSQPEVAPRRFVAYLSDLKEETELGAYPLLSRLIRERVKPERDALGDNPNNIPLKRRWWAYQAHRPDLYARLARRSRVLVHAEVSAYLAFRFVATDWIYNKTMVLVDLEEFSGFATVQSRVHEFWVHFTASTLRNDLGYRASDCFATFPFPVDWRIDPTLETAGKTYYDFRTDIMIRNDEGLTKTYNRFHDPDEVSSDILRLRELHAAMDRAVLDAYGWSDIPTGCEFLLDYEIDEEEWSPRKKKPWRYRWPDDVRDGVLARLLELNAERAKEEALAGATKPKKGTRKPATKRRRQDTQTRDLFS